ncbi:MAG: hypothetical protein KatS3mg103_0235 [Phycisphaerales bacterium]|nr:MAG: hypothetical protein KatS3mg103_0235 [Phycisphaerales bacterium]
MPEPPTGHRVLASRRLSTAVLALVASAWAGALVVAGLWLVFTAGPRWPMFSVPATLGGWTAMAMGMFVFMFLVADRVFPIAGRTIGWMVEVAFVALFTLGCLATAWALWF